MENFNNLDLSLRVLIFACVILLIPIILGLILPIVKPTIKRKSNIYLYSFSAGFILVLGLFGLIAQPMMELQGELSGHGHEHGNSHAITTHYEQWQVILIMAGVAIAGVVLGMGGSFVARHIFIKKAGEVHGNHDDHNHDDHIFNIKEAQSVKSKMTVITLLAFHKLPAGISLGLMIHGMTNVSSGITIAAIVAFIIHMIPEMLTIYYRQIEMGVNRWKAMAFTIAIQTLLVPLMFVGAYIGEAIESVVWLMPLILVMSGSVLVFTAIIELIPEFIDQKISHAKWHVTMILFVIGFMMALLILLIHTH